MQNCDSICYALVIDEFDIDFDYFTANQALFIVIHLPLLKWYPQIYTHSDQTCI